VSRRQREPDATMSLDSFLDIVTNVVGVLILVAVVTVLGAGDVAVSSGASATRNVDASAPRTLFELSRSELFFVDEERNGDRVKQEVQRTHGDRAIGGDELVATLNNADVGDGSHRVRAEQLPSGGLAWVYALRASATGETCADLAAPDSRFRQKLYALPPGGFVYFVVHDDSFELFRCARDLAREAGAEFGWHPVEGKSPLRLSVSGDLGRRIQ
jgi:hypothetical protein